MKIGGLFQDYFCAERNSFLLFTSKRMEITITGQ